LKILDQIINAPFDFPHVSSNFKNWSYKDVNKNDSLIILKELDLTKAAVGQNDHVAVAVAIAVTWATATDGAAYWKIYNQAKEEFEKTGKIKGFEVLNLRSMDRLWISHFDMEILVKS